MKDIFFLWWAWGHLPLCSFDFKESFIELLLLWRNPALHTHKLTQVHHPWYYSAQRHLATIPGNSQFFRPQFSKLRLLLWGCMWDFSNPGSPGGPPSHLPSKPARCHHQRNSHLCLLLPMSGNLPLCRRWSRAIYAAWTLWKDGFPARFWTKDLSKGAEVMNSMVLMDQSALHSVSQLHCLRGLPKRV